MTSIWITACIFAAFFQTIRTGLQKHLKQHLSTDSINWVRYAFGLPFAGLYLWTLLQYGYSIPEINDTFLLYCIGGGIAQIIGTHLLISLFSHRNFAVGTTYAKTEALQTALLGIILFGEFLSIGGTIAIILGVLGVVIISLSESHTKPISVFKKLTHKTALIGIGAGLGFSLSGLFIRQATLILDGSAIISAALTLVTMIAIQIVILGAWVVYSNRNAFRQILQHLKPSILVGLTSTLGSIGWFTAFALTNAAYVKTVGQIELIFALLLSHKIFKETINRSEVAGMSLVVGSILLLVYFY
jgi:drug/metabolite transporter (DMT)-like permease